MLAANATAPLLSDAGRVPGAPLGPRHYGLMLFARTRIAEQKLVGMFREHKIDRQYWAVAFRPSGTENDSQYVGARSW